MEFRPKVIDESMNVSKNNVLKEALELVLGTIVALAILFIVIELLTAALIPYFPQKYEDILWKTMQTDSMFKASEKPEIVTKQKYVQSLVDKIPASAKPEGYKFQVIIIEQPEPNAFAIPGGKIAVTTGLLSTLKTENALVFVLGHEIGHFKNKDHLRSFGSGLVASIVLYMITGDSDVSNFIGSVSSIMNNVNSRKHETAADEWGLKALNATYGQVSGATEFFEEMEKERKQYSIEGYLLSHPLSRDRIEHLNNLIKNNNYKSGETKPLKLNAR